MPSLRRRHVIPAAASAARFKPSETSKMMKLLHHKKEDLFDEGFNQKLVDEFNGARQRRSSKLEVEDTRKWFLRNIEPKGEVVVSEVVVPKISTESSSDTVKGEKNPELAEWEFEARSSNGAWYDVATFLSHRTNSSGKLEVHVRYEGFGDEEDEWVIAKEAVRVRSISLESSECLKVAIGDLVVCFQERSKQFAAHYDAHVLGIQRKFHDIRGCRCLFLIRYDHDQTEETVPLGRLCARPPADINFFQDAVSFIL